MEQNFALKDDELNTTDAFQIPNSTIDSFFNLEGIAGVPSGSDFGIHSDGGDPTWNFPTDAPVEKRHFYQYLDMKTSEEIVGQTSVSKSELPFPWFA